MENYIEDFLGDQLCKCENCYQSLMMEAETNSEILEIYFKGILLIVLEILIFELTGYRNKLIFQYLRSEYVP
jgi:hypothetical protein